MVNERRVIGVAVVAACAIMFATMGPATSLLIVALLASYGLWMSRDEWPPAHRIIPIYAVAVLVQSAHVVEEYSAGFYRLFPPVFGAEPWSGRRFLAFNVVWLAVFILAGVGIARRINAAYVVAIFLALGGGIGNGLGHLALSARAGGYFPGAYTGAVALAIGGILAYRLMRKENPAFDLLFRDAVSAIDAGDVGTLERLLAEHPTLVRDRLTSPGAWLRDKVGRRALEDFFHDPYLLWFVAEDPTRNNTLPANIADVTRTIIDAAKRERVASLQEQLDYAVRLVAWSGVAASCGVQLALVDLLIDAGASPGDSAGNALVNGHVAAARRLVERGAALTLATAVCLERWDDAGRLAQTASARDKQHALVLAALNGNAAAVRRMLDLGADADVRSKDLYAHADPLHHAVCSRSLETVKALVEAGAALDKKDSAEDATPLGWAEYFLGTDKDPLHLKAFAEIAEYLREKGAS